MFSTRVYRQFFSQFMIATVLATPVAASASVVALQTSLGEIDIQLFEEAAPLTVANFLNYVNSGAYDSTFIHRSVAGFIIQGGGFAFNGTSAVPVPANPPVVNEFSPSRSNLRGTIAMAKVGNDPNSATNQWFFNLADNSANLDNQNGGFTVFGQVIGNGMTVVDAIAAVNRYDATAVLPLANGANNADLFTSIPLIGGNTLISVNSASVVPVPAAVWLLGSALAGLGAFGRRRLG